LHIKTGCKHAPLAQTGWADFILQEMIMKRTSVLCALALAAGLTAAAPAHAASTVCEMRFTLSGWSAIYKTASGDGKVTCDNGQTARVHLKATGGGLTAGKYKIRDGYGKFNAVSNISELFGDYAEGGADAGVVKSSTAQVLTKGDVSLALAGHGSGVNLGVSFGKFTISEK
jgi:hypothetical protein